MKYQLKYYSRELLYIVIQYDNCDEREREREEGWVAGCVAGLIGEREVFNELT